MRGSGSRIAFADVKALRPGQANAESASRSPSGVLSANSIFKQPTLWTCVIVRGLEARDTFLVFSSLFPVREAERREAFLSFSPFGDRAR